VTQANIVNAHGVRHSLFNLLHHPMPQLASSGWRPPVPCHLLAEAGFSPVLTEQAFHAVENHIVGYTLQEMSFPIEAAEVAEAGANFLRKLPADEYPDLATHVMQHLEGPGHVDEGDFEFALDLILDGVERIMDRA